MHSVAPLQGKPSLPADLLVHEVAMDSKIDSYEAKIFRIGRQKEILCRLTYEITPFKDGLLRWFLRRIEELE